MAARKNCLSRSAPEIHSHVAGTLSNQQTTTISATNLSLEVADDDGVGAVADDKLLGVLDQRVDAVDRDLCAYRPPQ